MSALLPTVADVQSCIRSSSSRRSASASARTTAEDGRASRPCSRRAMYSTLTPASVATSSGRNPGVRRHLPVTGNPTSAGCICSRRARRNSASVVTSPACMVWRRMILAPPVPGSSRPSRPMLRGRRSAHDHDNSDHRPSPTSGSLDTRPCPLVGWLLDPSPGCVEGARALLAVRCRRRHRGNTRGHPGERQHRRRVDRHRQPRSGRRRALPEVASRVRQSRIVTGRSRPGP